jgi:hypothetical protein
MLQAPAVDRQYASRMVEYLAKQYPEVVVTAEDVVNLGLAWEPLPGTGKAATHDVLVSYATDAPPVLQSATHWQGGDPTPPVSIARMDGLRHQVKV